MSDLAWIDAAIRDNPQVRIAQANYDIAVLEVDRQRAGHYPTVDLVASFNQGYSGATPSVGSSFANTPNDTHSGLIGVQLNVPLYLGGSIESRVRQAVANQERARPDLEVAKAELLADLHRLPAAHRHGRGRLVEGGVAQPPGRPARGLGHGDHTGRTAQHPRCRPVGVVPRGGPRAR